METLQNGFTLDIPPGAFPLSTDSMALAAFVKLPRNAKVLDLGSGCGTLGLLLCASDPGCIVTGIELAPDAHEAALENISRNGLSARLSSICADLRTIPIEPGSFQICISNPPYFSGGPASRIAPLARRDDTCSLDALCASAAKALKYGGDFFLVHKPERLAEVCACAVSHGLEPKKLCLVRHKAGSDASLILIHCRKGAKPGLLWEEWALHDENGVPTEIYQRIYHN